MSKSHNIPLKTFLLLLFCTAALYFVTTSLAASPNSKGPVNNYIVVLNDNENVDQVASELTEKHGLGLGFKYSIIRGFSASIPEQRLNDLKVDPRVKFVSEDKEVSIASQNPVTIQAQSLPIGILRTGANLNSNKGTGIGVAVIDTGIDLNHPDLKANIIANKSCVKSKPTGNDDNGHGSHVAGTIAALNNTSGVVGVAPEAKLIAVKVLNVSGSGTWSQVICGLDFVAANAQRYNIKVANLSLGGGGFSDNNCGSSNSDALHQAICNLKNAGVTLVAAAGNSGIDAASFVPAAYDDSVIAVSALNDSDGASGGLGQATAYGSDDTFTSWSNYGGIVDLAAPGVNILSTYKSGGYATISGTSMASPHVAGSAALYIKSHPGSSWSQVKSGLQSVSEALNSGHTDPSGLHPEPVVNASSL